MNPLDRHVVVDLETTGLSPRHGHRVIEIGAVAVEHGAIMEEFSTLIDAGVPIPPQVQAIHGITDEMLEGKPPPEEVFPRFYAFIAGSVLVAHNAAFDVRFLRLPDHTLETIYLHLFPNVNFLRQNHRALDDARMTAKIWLKMEGG